MRSTSSGRNNNFDAAGGGGGSILSHVRGCAVSRGDLYFRFNAEVIFEEFEARYKGLEVAVGTHYNSNGRGGLGGCSRRLGPEGLRKNVGTLTTDIVHKVDKRLNGDFSFMHCGRGDRDVAHFPARAGNAFAVEVDTSVWYGEGIFGYAEMGVRCGTT